MKQREQGPRIVVIPDLQVKPGVDTTHLEWIADYVVDKRPNVVVQLGDWADMPSLSSYDRGRKSAEMRRYADDVSAVKASESRFSRRLARRAFRPSRMVKLDGNHEARIDRAVEEDARLAGKLSIDDLGFKEAGWEVHPFLKPVSIHNIMFSHYFPISANGRVMQAKNGCPNAKVQGQRVQRSCVAGHLQGLDTSVVPTPFSMLHSVIAGSCYLHEEDYLTPMGQNHWQGILMLNDVRKNGYFDLVEVSLDYLRRRYG